MAADDDGPWLSRAGCLLAVASAAAVLAVILVLALSVRAAWPG
jgi:hypothetical protein